MSEDTKKRPRGVTSTISINKAMKEAEKTDIDFFTDPFIIQRTRLNNLFGRDYIDANPILVAAAVIEQELTALRLEMEQIQISITDISDRKWQSYTTQMEKKQP